MPTAFGFSLWFQGDTMRFGAAYNNANGHRIHFFDWRNRRNDKTTKLFTINPVFAVFFAVPAVLLLTLQAHASDETPRIHPIYCNALTEEQLKGRFATHTDTGRRAYRFGHRTHFVISPEAEELLRICGDTIFDTTGISSLNNTEGWSETTFNMNTVGLGNVRPEVLYANVEKRLDPDYSAVDALDDAYCAWLADNEEELPQRLEELVLSESFQRLYEHGYEPFDRSEHEDLIYWAIIQAEERTQSERRSDFIQCARRYAKPVEDIQQ